MMSTETEATGYEGWAAEVARRASGMEGVTRAEVESVLGSGWREVYEAGETLEEAASLVAALVGDRRRGEVVGRAGRELAAASSARVVFVGGMDGALRGRVMGEVGWRWEEAGTGSVKLLARVGEAGEEGEPGAGGQLAAMLSAESTLGRVATEKALAVYDLAGENVAEACRLARGGRRLLASMEAACAEELAVGVARGMQAAGWEADGGPVLVLFAAERVDAAWLRRQADGGVDFEWVGMTGAPGCR